MSYILLVDTREPGLDCHPWAPHIPDGVTIERATLPTGDFMLQGFTAVVERKSPSDLLSCIGGNRPRFERELQRSLEVPAFCIVVEGSLSECIRQSRGIHGNAIVGTVAAWSRRYCPVVFCDSPALATDFALRFLIGHARDTGAQTP